VVAVTGCYDLDRLRAGPDQGDASSDAASSDAAPPPADADAPETAAACPPVSPSDGLVAYYPLDETSGTAVHDCGGRALDGVVLAATPAWTTGHVGGGLRTSSSTGCVDLASGSVAGAFELAQALTLTAWIDVASFSTGGTAGYVVGKTLDPDLGGWRLATGTGAADGAVALPGNARLSVSAPMNAGVFTHVALVITAGKSIDLYVDGALRDTKSGVPNPLLPASAAHARIGCRSDGTEFFNGVVDEVRIYARALLASEILALAQR
jgi:hypothetical protein